MKRGITIVPVEQNGGSSVKQNFKGVPFIRNTPEYDIILKLGRINGYDDNRRVRDSANTYVPGSDVTMLLTEAMTPKRVLVGMDEFVKMLYETNVNPDVILNDNVRSKLEEYKKARENHSDNLLSPTNARVKISPTEVEKILKKQPRITLDRINIGDYQDNVKKSFTRTKKHAS